MSFLKHIFTWWHKQTFGTFIYTLFFGKFVGTDDFENRYYSDSKGKRWVVYKDKVESSKIPPEWHLWIHFLTKNAPIGNMHKFDWQKKHEKLKNLIKIICSVFIDKGVHCSAYTIWTMRFFR